MFVWSGKNHSVSPYLTFNERPVRVKPSSPLCSESGGCIWLLFEGPFLTKTSCCLFPSSWPGGSIREFPCSSEGRCGACCSTFPKSRRRRKTSTRYWAPPHQFTSSQHGPRKDSSQRTPWFYLISVSSRIIVGTMWVWGLNCVLCVSARRKVSFCSAERQTLDLIRKFSCQDQYIAAFSGCGEVF